MAYGSKSTKVMLAYIYIKKRAQVHWAMTIKVEPENYLDNAKERSEQ
jgi:hypothetical protein